MIDHNIALLPRNEKKVPSQAELECHKAPCSLLSQEPVFAKLKGQGFSCSTSYRGHKSLGSRTFIQ